jgi:hypothetical protein
MPKYRIKIIARTIETYEVETDSLEQAEDFWSEGKLVATDDNVENEILEAVEL